MADDLEFPPCRSEDPAIRDEWERLLRMRRVRDTDDGADRMSLQQQRCMVQMKTHSWRTAATMIGSAGIVIVAGVFAWGTNEHHEMRTTAALVSHSHENNALARELDTLRARLLNELHVINDKIDRLSHRMGASRVAPDPIIP